MKVKKEAVDERRYNIYQMLKQNKNLSIQHLSEHFNVSPLTISRDLRKMDEENKIKRLYGKIEIIDQNNIEDNLSKQDEIIAEYAASFIEEDDVIFLNSGSTSIRMLKYIKSKHITVITNNTNVLNEKYDSFINVVLTGGQIQDNKKILTGIFALNNIGKVMATKSFLSCNGLSVENGMTTEHINEVAVNNMMIDNTTDNIYILANHSKIGVKSNFMSSSINSKISVITDDQTDEKEIKKFTDKNIAVFIADQKNI